MQKTMRALALVTVTVMGMLVLAAGPASAQAAATPCPPGQPSGRPPGTPPGNPPGQTRRPEYPPGRCQMALSQSSAARGQTFRASGGGFEPGETVTLSIAGSPVKTVAADGNGAFDTDLVVPEGASVGRTKVVASGANQQLSADFEVVASAAAAAGGASAARASDTSRELPRTGVELAGIGAFGALLVAIGATAVAATRRRRTVTA